MSSAPALSYDAQVAPSAPSLPDPPPLARHPPVLVRRQARRCQTSLLPSTLPARSRAPSQRIQGFPVVPLRIRQLLRVTTVLGRVPDALQPKTPDDVTVVANALQNLQTTLRLVALVSTAGVPSGILLGHRHDRADFAVAPEEDAVRVHVLFPAVKVLVPKLHLARLAMHPPNYMRAVLLEQGQGRPVLAFLEDIPGARLPNFQILRPLPLCDHLGSLIQVEVHPGFAVVDLDARGFLAEVDPFVIAIEVLDPVAPLLGVVGREVAIVPLLLHGPENAHPSLHQLLLKAALLPGRAGPHLSRGVVKPVRRARVVLKSLFPGAFRSGGLSGVVFRVLRRTVALVALAPLVEKVVDVALPRAELNLATAKHKHGGLVEVDVPPVQNPGAAERSLDGPRGRRLLLELKAPFACPLSSNEAAIQALRFPRRPISRASHSGHLRLGHLCHLTTIQDPPPSPDDARGSQRSESEDSGVELAIP
eukprot:scaffold652_cov260-Pinguiococcus_pyrenoidosus.AAC.16